MLGLCWAWAHVGFVGPMVRHVGPCWVYAEPMWAYVCSMFGRVGPIWAYVGPMLGLCWAVPFQSFQLYQRGPQTEEFNFKRRTVAHHGAVGEKTHQ